MGVGRSGGPNRDGVAIDPLFPAGTAIAGAGAALATTIGPMMYGVLGVGLVVMAIGASHSRHRDDHR